MRALPELGQIQIGTTAAEDGPRILFFSGGTALRSLCRVLKRATHNSIHIVTPFDSGGSSGPLREAFGMPGIGDLRNRMVSLADEETPGCVESARLVSHRLDAHNVEAGRQQLEAIVTGRDALVADVPPALREFACARLRTLTTRAPQNFDLRGASVGNLILTGAWLERRDLRRAVRALSEFLSVRGAILPTVEADLHLAALLEDGSRIVGQHRITGKQVAPLPCGIREIQLVAVLDESAPPVEVAASEEVLAAISTADLICFPMGSFFSSVLCNLLPRGIGLAIAEARCPKVYVPNAGADPEMRGIDPARATALLIGALRRDAGSDVPTDRLLNFVLLTEEPTAYALPADADAIARLGPEPRATLTSARGVVGGEIDSEQLAAALLSLAARREPDGA
jgi:CofD-related protein of GAK system